MESPIQVGFKSLGCCRRSRSMKRTKWSYSKTIITWPGNLHDLHGKRNHQDSRHTRRITLQNRVLRIRAGVGSIAWLGRLVLLLRPFLERRLLGAEADQRFFFEPDAGQIGRGSARPDLRRKRPPRSIREQEQPRRQRDGKSQRRNRTLSPCATSGSAILPSRPSLRPASLRRSLWILLIFAPIVLSTGRLGTAEPRLMP